jgi:hypothetical protein
MHTAKKIAVLVLVTGVTLWNVGCGSKGDLSFMSNAVPATGRVTVEGKPLPGANIRFIPTIQSTGGREATAITDADGAYEMSTLAPGVPPDQSKGVIPGEYTVVLSRVAMPDGGPPPADIIDENDAIAKGLKQYVPAPYTNPETSPLKITVAAPKAENNFDL